MIATHDGGTRWQTLPDPCPHVVGRLAAWDAQHLWRLCDLGRAAQFIDPMGLYRSVDGGEHWDLIAQTDDADHTSLPNGLACTMTFISSERGFMALCGATGGLIMSDDGGQTWKNVELESQNNPVTNCLAASSTSQLIFMDAQQGWVIQDFTNFCESSTQSWLYRTVDGGVTWKQVATTFQP